MNKLINDINEQAEIFLQPHDVGHEITAELIAERNNNVKHLSKRALEIHVTSSELHQTITGIPELHSSMIIEYVGHTHETLMQLHQEVRLPMIQIGSRAIDVLLRTGELAELQRMKLSESSRGYV